MRFQASDPRVTFQDLPVEIIHLLFVYSLPDNPLDHKQPDLRIAPMLLCRVCSQWRSIALKSPGLWAYLHHRVPLPKQEMLRRTGIYPIALDFLKWWRCNLNENHPFHFRFYADCNQQILRPEGRPLVQEHILVTLFNLAQHLDINCKISWLVHDEDPMLSFPNLETLRIRYDLGWLYSASQFFPLRPKHPILKLHMQHFKLDDVYKRPIVSWSSLTHLVFEGVQLSSGEWFDLIRACVNLQFGYFDLDITRASVSEDPRLANPPHFTHRHLREFVVRCDDHYTTGNIDQYLLKNLFFPSLTTFRLSARLTTQDLHYILKSLPFFTTLYWVAGNSIWFRPCDDEHFLQIHSRRVTPSSRRYRNRNPPIATQGVTPRHPNHPSNFICVYRRADDRIYQQSLLIELFATGRADKQYE
jgi:hypothetical protein